MGGSKALLRLLHPKSIAVIGGHEAGEVIRQCDKLGFKGDIWPVNPKRDSLEGHSCFARLEDLPAAPDATFIAIPANPTVEAVAILSGMEAGGAVCYASGFKEVEDGGPLQEKLVQAAGTMPIIGPNCYGVLNYFDGAALWPDQHGGARCDKGVAIITQSGNIGLNLSMQARALDIGYLIALGNQAAIGIEDCMDALLDDPRITAIGLHVEGLGDITAFEEAALKAARQEVPIVALKAGRSEQGASIALSHTATLTGEDDLYDAFFKRLGVARTHTIPDFLETLKLLSLCGPLSGNKLVSMSCSGGEASLIADLARDLPLSFPDITEQHSDIIRATLNEYVAISNPLDYHTFIWGDEERMTACFSAVMQGDFDMTLLILDFPRKDRCETKDWHTACRALVRAAQATGGKAAVVPSLPEGLDEETGRYLGENGIIAFFGMTEALNALVAAVAYGTFLRNPPQRPLRTSALGEGKPRIFDEWRSKRLLSSLAISTPNGSLVRSATEAVAAAESMGYPVVLKIVSDTLVHKTEAGGVVLHLADGDQVFEAAERLLSLADTLLIEQMITDSVAELIVGVDRDPQFGTYLVVGFGGVLVELIGDSGSVLLPTNREAVIDTLRSLKVSALFDGYRGQPRGDFDAAVDAVLAVAGFVEDNASRIDEIDINPLMVRPLGKGVVALDAYIKMIEGN